MSSLPTSVAPSLPVATAPSALRATGLKWFNAGFAPGLTMLAILLVWELGCRLFKIPEFLLPAPSAIWKAMATLSSKEWFGHVSGTLSVALIGYALSIVISIPLGIALALSPLLSRTIYPLLVVVHSTPIVAIAPIMVVTMGVGTLPRVMITCLIAFFPLVISTATGIASTPPELIELSRSLRASRLRQVVQIRLPYAVPHIFSALKVSITLAIVGAVVAEFVAAEKGLGYAIMFATSSFKIPQAFAGLALLVVISLVLFRLVFDVQRYFFPWSLPKAGS
jgi:NitT/TauT family transport system permease protein